MPRSSCLKALRGAARHLAAMMLLLPLATASCSNGIAPQFPPACPRFTLIPGAADLQRSRNGGRDITDQILVAKVEGVGGTCAAGSHSTTRVSLVVHFTLQRGPAAPGRTVDLPWTIGVTEGDRVVDQQAFSIRATFPPNTDTLDLQTDPKILNFPVTPGESAAAYRVWIGFLVTPQDMAANRAHPLP